MYLFLFKICVKLLCSTEAKFQMCHKEKQPCVVDLIMSDERFFSKQKLLKVWFCGGGVAAPPQPLPATLHQGERHLLAALRITARVGGEVVPHRFGGVGGEAETRLCRPALRVRL